MAWGRVAEEAARTPRGYTLLARPATAGWRQLAAAALLASLLAAAALVGPRLPLGRDAGAAAAPSRLFARMGEDGHGHATNGTHDDSDSDSGKSDPGGKSESDPGSGKKQEREDEEGKEEPVKGAPFKVRLVSGTSSGCCAWGGRCDDSNAFCNDRKANCDGCGGTWKDKFLPSKFSAAPSAWCARGKMGSWRVPAPPVYIRAAHAPVEIKALTYNLQWWKVYKKKHGMGGSEGHLIRDTGPYDIIGLQECQNPWRVLFDAGLDQQYQAFQGGQTDSTQVCAAFRKTTWEELGHGTEFVAEDGAGKYNYYGKRIAVWFRLRHRASGETLLFVNHHGPLPLSSGGKCGGHATGYNILELIAHKARQGDAVVLMGDFNAGPGSMTVRTLGSQLARVYSGWRFGGIDHVFTNLGHGRVVDKRNLGKGGSDHDALSVTLRLGLEGAKVVA